MRCFGHAHIFQISRNTLHYSYFNNVSFKRTFTSKNENFKDEQLLLFFKSEVQDILKKLTGFKMSSVFTKRKLGDKLDPPKYKFMTSEELEQVMKKYRKQAKEFMQMPPVVPIRKEIDVVLSKDPELIGLDESKFLITDISFGKSERTRAIVVRDTDGTLRKAFWAERRIANQTYFPKPGRQFKIPKMFQAEHLKPVLERGDYIFILDRACVEFDADDPEYHRVTYTTYNHIEETRSYGTLRFTRHFGPMVFYFVLSKTIDNLLLENLQTDRLDDAVALVTLYHLIHSTTRTKLEHGQEIAFIKDYIEKNAKMKVALDLALLALSENSKSQAMGVCNN